MSQQSIWQARREDESLSKKGRTSAADRKPTPKRLPHKEGSTGNGDHRVAPCYFAGFIAPAIGQPLSEPALRAVSTTARLSEGAHDVTPQ
jgi:hypothetical protein